MSTSSTEYRVTGMTCAHCVAAVTEEITALPGVSQVDVVLDPAGVSTVTVAADAPPTAEQLAAALDEAGDYRLVAS